MRLNAYSLEFQLSRRWARRLKYTADNLSNAKPAVQQRHLGNSFPVSQRGSTKGKQKTSACVWKPLIWTKMYIFEIKECYFVSFISVFSCTKGYGQVFPRCCDFSLFRETPVKMRKIWDKHDDILLVLTIIALWATKKTSCWVCI